MKTVTKVTAVTLIAIFALFACTGEAELTTPNFNEYNKKFASNNVGGINDLPSDPSFVADTLYYNDPPANSEREITVVFPMEADFLRKSPIKLDDFLSFFMYTEDSDAPSENPSNVGEKLTFKFVRMVAINNKDVAVVVRLDEFPDTITSPIVGKIDSSKYTYAGGNKPGNGEFAGKRGESPYDDIYKTFTVSGASNNIAFDFIPPGGEEQGTGWSFDLSAFNISGTLETVGTVTTVTAIVGDTTSIGGGVDETDAKAVEEISKKLAFEQFDAATGTWKSASGTFAVNESNEIELKFTPADRVPYRVKANGVKNLEIGPYYGAKQRVKVSGYGYPSSYNYAAVYSEVSIWEAPLPDGITNITPPATLVSSMTYECDVNGKNVKLRLRVNLASITDGDGPMGIYLGANPNLAAFNKNFKLAHAVDDAGNDNTPINSLNSILTADSVRFVDIIKVEYAANNEVIDEIILTLDPDYRYNAAGCKAVLLAPGFAYSDPLIKFGNYGNLTPIDGVYFFGYYGTLTF